MDKMPKVSVVMPVRDGARFLRRAKQVSSEYRELQQQRHREAVIHDRKFEHMVPWNI